jgi:predicted metal-binding membrane protein
MPIGFSRNLTLAVLALAATAWVLLAWPGSDWHGHHQFTHPPASLGVPTHPGQAGHHHHHGTVVVPDAPSTGTTPWFGPLTATVLFGWVLMVTAMMLPPALPVLDLLRRLVARHRHPRLLIGLGAMGFVGVWTAAGVLLIASDAAARGFAEQVGWAQHVGPGPAAGGVLILAGLYQFTPMKTACLRACRSPRGFAIAHWRGARPAWLEAPTVTGAYAASCVGCCWALMAVTFVVGVAALPVMVVLAVLMAAERLLRRGRRLVRPIGVATVLLGVLAVFELLPLGLPA